MHIYTMKTKLVNITTTVNHKSKVNYRTLYSSLNYFSTKAGL